MRERKGGDTSKVERGSFSTVHANFTCCAFLIMKRIPSMTLPRHGVASSGSLESAVPFEDWSPFYWQMEAPHRAYSKRNGRTTRSACLCETQVAEVMTSRRLRPSSEAPTETSVAYSSCDTASSIFA